MLKTFLLKLKVLFELITTVICAYVAIVGTFSSLLFNFIFFVVAIFTLSQALGTIDIINGNGQQPDAGNPDDNQNPGNPDNPDAGFPDSSSSENDETQDSSSTENDTIEFIIDDNHDNIDDGVEENDTFNYKNNDYPEIPE